MSNMPSSNTASEINSCELTLFIKDSVRGGCIFYLNHHLTCYKSFTEPHINHTPIISNQGPYTAVYIHRALGSPGGCSRSRRCRWSRRPRSAVLGERRFLGWLPPLPAASAPGTRRSPATGTSWLRRYLRSTGMRRGGQHPLCPHGDRPGRLRHAAPAQPLPERPPSPGAAQKPTFQALKLLFKSNSDKDLFSLNMTGCWPRGDFGSGAGGSWPQISGALTGAGGDAEPLQEITELNLPRDLGDTARAGNQT